MKRVTVLFAMCFFAATMVIAQPVFNIKNFGAIADGKTINTRAIQTAIDSCNKSGGGSVVVGGGVYITGSLQMKSNVNLYIAAGAVLKGSSQLADYIVDGKTKGVIFGEDLINVSITGEGEINGSSPAFFDPAKMHTFIDFDKKYVRQGQAFFDALKPADGPIFYKDRPNMTLVLMHCENVKLAGVHFVDAPSWTIRLGDCQDVLVDGISIKNNPLVPNSDGVHMTLCRNARVTNCNILAGDDAIIVSGFGDEIDVHNASNLDGKKNFKYGNKTGIAENIIVSGCILQSLSAGIRVGYGKGNMRNLIFSNIIIHESNRGILMNAREEGSINNVLFENFIIKTKHLGGTWWGRGEPIHVSSFPFSKGVNNGTISNISFKNINISSETGIVVWASEMGKVLDIKFDNVAIQINNSANVAAFGGNIDLRPTPDFATNLFKRDLPALLLNNVGQVKLQSVSNKFNGTMPAFYTHGLEVANSDNITITNCDFSGTSKKFIPVLVNKSSGVQIKNNEIQ